MEIQKRIEWIDTLKGALMIGVIWSHSAANIGGGYLLTACYMSAFYFISGYVSKEYFSLRVLCKKKCKRLLIPCFVYGIVLVGIDMFFSGSQGALNKWIGVIYSRYMLFPHDLQKNIFFLKSYNSTLWFLTSMFSTYMCFYAFQKSKKKAVFISVLFVLGYVLMYGPVLLPWSIDSVPVTSLVMIGGYCFRNVAVDSMNIGKKIGVLIFLLPIYVACVTFNPGINLSIREYGIAGIKGYLLYYVIAFTGTGMLMILFSMFPTLTALIFIGQHTMTYICLQIFALAVSYKVLLPLNMNGVVAGWISVCVTLIVIWSVVRFYNAAGKKIKLFKYL